MNPYNRWTLEECACGRCGKIFLPPDKEVWTYKAELGKSHKKTYFCSYSCWRAATEESEKFRKQRGRRMKLSEADIDNMHHMLKSGVKRNECARFFGVTHKTIQHYIDTRKGFQDIREMLEEGVEV